ncbi:MAG: GtrA family protein [Candidatus Sericytochromatia bacterium]|nr:GtrA family protein [Candidatus Sericytochromatia bacterium]
MVLERTGPRFLLAGAVNTALGYSVFFVALLESAPRWLQLLAANGVAVALNFLTARQVGFRQRGWRPLAPRFVAVYPGLHGGDLVALEALVGAGWRPFWAAVVVLPAVTVLTYALQRWFVFAPRG